MASSELSYNSRRPAALGPAYWLKEDEHDIDFENPRTFVVDRWKAAVDSYRLSSADLDLVDNVTDERAFDRYVRKTLRDAQVSGPTSTVTAFTSILQLYRPLWYFAEMIQDIEPGVRDVAEEVDVSPLWSMAYLNIKLSLGSSDKLKRTAQWMTDFRRQMQLLLSALKQTGDDGRSMRIEMSEIFDPTLAILYETVQYLQRHDSDEDFVHSWLPVMNPKIKAYLEAMEGTIKHIRAMSTTRHITQLQESRIGELGVREREIIMDGSEKAIFPVDNLPTHRTPHFTGRIKEIDRIHAWLGVEQNTRLRTFLIYGRRGIGKTQIALEYAARYMRPTYDAIFWIQCETSASLRNSFAEIATALELDGADKNGHFEENLMKVLRWLTHTKKRWLLIYDNAERENLLKGFWPVGARGSILLTSRSFYNFFEDDQRQGETVPVFSIEESNASLMAHLGQDWQTVHLGEANMLADVERAAANTLLHQTGGLPLAINHAAKLILNKKIGMKRERDQGDDTIHGFLELFRESHMNLPKRQTGERDPLIHSLDTIWSIAFDALSMNARAILSVLALVSPDVILIDLFLPSDQERLTDKLAFCTSDTTDLRGRSTVLTAIKMSSALQAAIDELVHQGMVLRAGRNLTIHREVQEAVNYRSKSDLQASFDAGVNLLYDAFPQQKEGRPMTDEKDSCRRWIQHAIALANKYNIYSKGRRPENDFPLEGMASRKIFVKLLANCAWYLFEIADYDECLNIISIARSACDDQQSLEYAHLLNTESTTYFEQNRLRQSREAALAAHAIREEKLSPDAADYAIVLANLGNIESAQGKYDEALTLLEQAAGIRYSIGDDAAVMLALNYLQIGRVYFLQGQHTMAYNSFQKCEGVFMKKAGRNSWFLADLHYAYGNLEFAQGDFVSAGKSYDRARRICMEQNPLHPLTAAVFYKLACTEREQDHHTKALGFIEKAMSIAEVRSPNIIDGTLARITWKKSQIMLEDLNTGPERRRQAEALKEDMESRQAHIAEALGIKLKTHEDEEDKERSFDLLVAGYYR